MLRSQVKLFSGWQWNAAAYFVDRLPAGTISSYTRLDSNLTWQAGERWSFSVVGQNLLRNRHPEYSGPDSSVQAGQTRRNVFAKVEWSF